VQVVFVQDGPWGVTAAPTAVGVGRGLAFELLFLICEFRTADPVWDQGDLLKTQHNWPLLHHWEEPLSGPGSPILGLSRFGMRARAERRAGKIKHWPICSCRLPGARSVDRRSRFPAWW